MANVEENRLKRRRLLRNFLVIFGILVAFGFLYIARQLVIPFMTAAILSYLCKPIVYALRRRGVSAGLSVSIVAGSLIFSVTGGLTMAYRALPQGIDLIEAQIRAENKVNKVVKNLLKIHEVSQPAGTTNEPAETGIWIYEKFKKEIDFLMSQLNAQVRLSEADEKILVSDYQVDDLILQKRSKALKEQYRAMVKENRERVLWKPEISADSDSIVDATKVKAQLSSAVSSLSIWILVPIIFCFLLADSGGAFKFGMKMVPNHYFELTLTILERVDKAIGHYLRGTALECASVGFVIGFGLFLFGVNLPAAVLIGLISGITNAIPFLGTVVGILAGLTYGIIAEDVSPLIPFLSSEDLFIGVFVSVGFAHVLDNAYFQPIMVGKAVNLHPVVIIMAVAAGGLSLGFIGLLLAVPSVVIVKTFLATLIRGLRDYRLI